MTKKILITTGGLSSVGQHGGVSAYVHDLAVNLTNGGHNVTVFLIKEFINMPPKDVLYTYRLFPIQNSKLLEELQVGEIRRAIRTLKPEIIINNDTSYLAGLWPTLDGSIIKISVMHAFRKSFTFGNAGIVGKMASINHEYLDYIICQNSMMLSDVASKYKIPKNKLIFIPQTTFQTIPKVKVNSACFTILFAGGQNLLKGSRQMKIVAGYLKSSVYTFRLKWCLDAGNMKAGFEDDVRFEFLGDLPREDFYRVLQSSDCIIIPTRMDTGPLLVVEAMSYGVIPICNNLSESAIVDLVEHLKNGILVDNNNPKSFYEFLVLLMNNKEVKQDLKKNALKFFSKNLTPTKQLERFEALFENKKFFKKEDSFSGINVIYYHLKKTNHLPRYSFKRIRSKLTNALEIPMYKNRT